MMKRRFDLDEDDLRMEDFRNYAYSWEYHREGYLRATVSSNELMSTEYCQFMMDGWIWTDPEVTKGFLPENLQVVPAIIDTYNDGSGMQIRKSDPKRYLQKIGKSGIGIWMTSGLPGLTVLGKKKNRMVEVRSQSEENLKKKMISGFGLRMIRRMASEDPYRVLQIKLCMANARRQLMELVDNRYYWQRIIEQPGGHNWDHCLLCDTPAFASQWCLKKEMVNSVRPAETMEYLTRPLTKTPFVDGIERYGHEESALHCGNLRKLMKQLDRLCLDLIKMILSYVWMEERMPTDREKIELLLLYRDVDLSEKKCNPKLDRFLWVSAGSFEFRPMYSKYADYRLGDVMDLEKEFNKNQLLMCDGHEDELERIKLRRKGVVDKYYSERDEKVSTWMTEERFRIRENIEAIDKTLKSGFEFGQR